MSRPEAASPENAQKNGASFDDADSTARGESQPRAGVRVDTELARLNKLRRDVAAGLLEVSKAAKRDAERLLSDERAAELSSAKTHRTDGAGQNAGGASWWRGHGRLYGSFLVGAGCGVALTLATLSEPVEVEPQDAVAPSPLARTAAVPEPPPSSEPVRATAEATGGGIGSDGDRPLPSTTVPDSLRVSFTAQADCWVRVQVDDEEGWERLLTADQQIVVDAEEQVRVRVGNAAALSMFINDQTARPLGRQGQVVDLRITPANYKTFLKSDSVGP